MSLKIRVIAEGDYALFCRPEMKSERVSYDVPTVSALEGLIKCVYWKPAFRICIDKIIVFNPIHFTNIRRNEVKSKVSLSAVKAQMKGKGSPVLYADEERSQRASMLLRDVKYGIEFHLEMTGFQCEKEDENVKKHYHIMMKRLQSGKCFRQPCLGCREFSVKKLEMIPEDADFDYSQISPELKGDTDLGFMLYRMKFADRGIPKNHDWENPQFSDKADALYYRPHMIDGVIDVNRYRRDAIC
ncbi:MAG: type I-C CRISPR-associated protein Cas5 [Oscillospiraceae bacterium]|nr:type I-C CRISPR-associated protein Cas5 [Oscillospiraceae bacterium]